MNQWAKRNPEKSIAGIQPSASFAHQAQIEDKASNVHEFAFELPKRPFGSVLAEIASVPGDGRGGDRSKGDK